MPSRPIKHPCTKPSADQSCRFSFTYAKDFKSLFLAPRVLTPSFSNCWSSKLIISCHFKSFKLSVYLCKRRVLSQRGMSTRRLREAMSSGEADLTTDGGEMDPETCPDTFLEVCLEGGAEDPALRIPRMALCALPRWLAAAAPELCGNEALPADPAPALVAELLSLIHI